jgi:DNA-binding LacI/PurR family transcriptional regulator
LEDVAAAAGVSRALVSIVMRGAPGASTRTRERVLAVAAQLGYRPDSRARLLAQSRSRLIGVTLTVHHPFHADLVQAIYPAAEQAGYEVVLSALTQHRDEHRAVETLLDYRCEAIILLGPESRGSWLATLGERLPVVSVGRTMRRSAVDVVRTADGDGVRQGVDHLVALGHRRIAHLDGARGSGAAERRRAYRASMRAHGLGREINVLPGGQSEEAGGAAGRNLLASDRVPTAVVCYNDRTAVGLLESVHRADVLVPEQLSVVGFDDSQLARLWSVNLTSVGQDATGLGTLAVQRAVDRIGGKQVGGEIVLPPWLVVRGSTGPPPLSDTAGGATLPVLDTAF